MCFAVGHSLWSLESLLNKPPHKQQNSNAHRARFSGLLCVCHRAGSNESAKKKAKSCFVDLREHCGCVGALPAAVGFWATYFTSVPPFPICSG